ncbi:MotA/TolQ/ExbB proton channel family protein [Campylobacter sputorum]|uniref:MotA/TolQ/ExbB proton channel family protein n=1 Tax=Campylobacter sputorum TaxID=206 RepID=UPI000B76C6F8|nr:MotA/TolQ/ExbB proton channel family protein [Campylobacter sputorum]ASM36595.1 putative membrane protein [Campylobacter sputorum bv. faecalis CCUG 20703]
MDLKNDAFSELNLSEIQASQTRLVYFKIIVLPTIFYIVFLLGYFKYINFEVGLHTVIMMGVIYIVSLIFARHSAELGCSIFEHQLDEFKKDLRKYIIKNLLTIAGEKRSNAGFDEFVENHSRHARNEHFASVGAVVFPMLGILGTFISIAISMPKFETENFGNLEIEISGLLSGVGTAFYISIYGIFLALWWLFFEKYGMSRFEKIINRLRNDTSGFFWTKEDIEQRYLSESLKHFDKIGVIFDYVANQEFFNELNNSVEKKFETFKNILLTEEKAVKLSSEHIKHTSDMLLRSQRDQKDIVKVHAEMLNILHAFSSNLKELQLDFSKQYTRLHDLSEDRLSKIEKIISTFEENIYKFNLSLNKFSENILDKQKISMEGFQKSIFEGMKSFKEVFEKENSDIYDTNSQEMIGEYKKNVDKLDEEVNKVLDKINKLDEDMSQESSK